MVKSQIVLIFNFLHLGFAEEWNMLQTSHTKEISWVRFIAFVIFWESSKHGICILLCLWLRSRSSGSLVKLVNIWFHQKEQMVEKYLHVLDFRFNSKLIEDDSHWSLLSQAQGLSNVGNLRRQSIYLQWIRHTEYSSQVGSIIMTKIKGAKITDPSEQKCAKSCEIWISDLSSWRKIKEQR